LYSDKNKNKAASATACGAVVVTVFMTMVIIAPEQKGEASFFVTKKTKKFYSTF